MKTAKDFFEKYEKLIFSFPMGAPVKTSTSKEVTLPPTEDFMNAIVRSILQDFSTEFFDRLKEQPVLDPSIMNAILIAVNHEWNGLIELFETEYGEKVLKPDGFIDFVKKMDEKPIEETPAEEPQFQNATIKGPFDFDEEGM